MKRFRPTLLFTSLLTAAVLPSSAFVLADGNTNRQASTVPNAQTDETTSDGGDRDITSLLEWASQNSVKLSPRISLTSSRIDGADHTDYGVVLHRQTSTTKTETSEKKESEVSEEDEDEVLLSVPRTIVLDSKTVHSQWSEHLRQPMDYLTSKNFADARYNFVLVVKLLHEHSLQNSKSKSKSQGWIQSLPKTFTTGTVMTPFEIDCLPPFSRAMADYERERLRVFREALRLLVRQRRRRQKPLLDAKTVEDEELTMWAFNVVSTRSWVYEGEEEDVGYGRYKAKEVEGSKRKVAHHSIMVPMGDMFNHRDPPNVEVRDSPDGKEVLFVLVDDGTADRDGVVVDVDVDVDGTTTDRRGGDGDESEGGGSGIVGGVGGGDIFLSYGIATNPHRFLIRFGFANTQMNEIFSQVLFESPSPSLLALGSNDRTKMVYRTMDGAIANTVWDAVLYSMLEEQVPDDAKAFYQAHVDGDKAGKAAVHDRYVMETSLTLRTHVVKELEELGEVLRKIDGEDMEALQQHPRLPMIRRHNEFLYRTLDMVRRRIDARAQTELGRRKGEAKVEAS